MKLKPGCGKRSRGAGTANGASKMSVEDIDAELDKRGDLTPATQRKTKKEKMDVLAGSGGWRANAAASGEWPLFDRTASDKPGAVRLPTEDAGRYLLEDEVASGQRLRPNK